MKCKDCGYEFPVTVVAGERYHGSIHACAASTILDQLARLDEIGGPEGREYVAVMRAVAREATRCADNAERNLDAPLPDDTPLEGWFTCIGTEDVPEDVFNLTWAEYKEINADSDELDALEAALLKGETFYGGGGAAVSYLVRRMR